MPDAVQHARGSGERGLIPREELWERLSGPGGGVIMDAIPLTAVGKPFKPELRRRAAEHAATDALAGTAPQADVRAVLADGAVVIQVRRGADDPLVREVLSAYVWRWEVV
jgi:fatty-acyl-CoA synthase